MIRRVEIFNGATSEEVALVYADLKGASPEKKLLAIEAIYRQAFMENDLHGSDLDREILGFLKDLREDIRGLSIVA